MTSRILAALSRVRLTKANMPETAIHDAIAAELDCEGLAYVREYHSGPRCRFDFWLPVSGTVIEVKRRRPEPRAVIGQLSRYANQSGVSSLVLVLERSIELPSQVQGVPLHVISLNSNWGVSL